MPNELSAHLYKDGHVTHDWQQSRFLQEAFQSEDALRAEVEQYGQARPKRNRMLDWSDGGASSTRSDPNQRKLNTKSFGNSSRSQSSRGSYSTCSCGCSATGRSSLRSGSSRQDRSCRSSMMSSECSSFCSCDCHSTSDWSDYQSTGRSSAILTGRTDSTHRVDALLTRKRRLEAQLQALEEELQETSSLASSSASARTTSRSLQSTGKHLSSRSQLA